MPDCHGFRAGLATLGHAAPQQLVHFLNHLVQLAPGLAPFNGVAAFVQKIA